MKKINHDGFTIIELLVAILLFAILVPTLITFLTSIDSLNKRANDLALVNSTLENKVEALRSQGYNAVTIEPDGSPRVVDFTDELPDRLSAPKSASYTVSQSVQGLKQIDVAITYHSINGPQDVELRTYLGEIGVGQY